MKIQLAPTNNDGLIFSERIKTLMLDLENNNR